MTDKNANNSEAMGTSKMIQDSELWAGLNRPGITLHQADTVILGVPYDGGVSFRAGAKDAPAAIRSVTYTIAPTTELFEVIGDLKVMDLGDFPAACGDNPFREVEETVCQIVSAGKFFTMLGGDHSTTIPVLTGIDRALQEPFGIIHIDAHFDLCDKLKGSRISHGCTQRRALELKNIKRPENIFFLGIRSIELEEAKFIRDNPVTVLSARDLHHIGITEAAKRVKNKMRSFKHVYLTLDIDCLDPAYAAGTGTPQFGGMSARELLNLLYELFELPIIGFDVVEVAPNLDPSLTSVFAARKIIMECWGHFYRKSKIIEGKYK